MKTSIKSFVSLCAIYFLASGLALAQPAVIELHEGYCQLWVEVDGEIYPDLITVADDKVKISTSSSNGNINLTCSADVPPPISGRSEVFSFSNTGELCNVSGNPTEDWHQIVSASGKARLSCHFKQ